MAETFGGSRDYYADLEVSEDCLYLNVWTPTLERDANLPVMVWVHGGSNKSGWSYEPNYHGHALAQKEVVVVSVAYRQGAFGFLSHPDLGDVIVSNTEPHAIGVGLFLYMLIPTRCHRGSGGGGGSGIARPPSISLHHR